MFTTQPPAKRVRAIVPYYLIPKVEDDDDDIDERDWVLRYSAIPITSGAALKLRHVIDDIDKGMHGNRGGCVVIWPRTSLNIDGWIMAYSGVLDRVTSKLAFDFDECT